MNILPVEAGDHHYDIHVGRLRDCAGRLRSFHQGHPLTVISDEHVWGLHGSALQSMIDCEPLFVAEGEAAKDWETLQRLIEQLAARNLDRSTAILAFGGGSVGDVAGLAAGLFKRGVPIIHVPTTLLSQADSAVGGKTAIDACGEKNLVGLFHQPAMVIADAEFLRTLDPRQMRSGYAEIVKYGLIGDPAFFEWLERRGSHVLSGDLVTQEEAIWQSVSAKARHVEADVTDRSGVRALLNLGHTFGHAIESAAGLGTILHGEAIAVGMVLAFDLSTRLGHCPADDSMRVRQHLASHGLPVSIGDLAIDRNTLVPLMRADKKNDGGKLRLVLARGIGRAFLSDGVAEDVVADFLAAAA